MWISSAPRDQSPTLLLLYKGNSLDTVKDNEDSSSGYSWPKKGAKVLFTLSFSAAGSVLSWKIRTSVSYFSVLWFSLTKVTFPTGRMKNNIYLDSTARRTSTHHRPDVRPRWQAMGDMDGTSWHLKTAARSLLSLTYSKYKSSNLWPSDQYVKIHHSD